MNSQYPQYIVAYSQFVFDLSKDSAKKWILSSSLKQKNDFLMENYQFKKFHLYLKPISFNHQHYAKIWNVNNISKLTSHLLFNIINTYKNYPNLKVEIKFAQIAEPSLSIFQLFLIN